MEREDMSEKTEMKEIRRARTLRFRVSPDEAREIEDRAEGAGATLSAYLRATALNHRIKSVYDLDAIGDLVRVNGDLGRVAGLLKLWLAEKPGQGARPFDVDRMMREFRALQTELSGIMRRAVK